MKMLSARFGSILVAFSGVVVSGQALAQEATCDTDADCDHGYQCKVTASSGCAAPACPEGEDCAEPPPCEPMEWKSCVAASGCEGDSDCAAGMACTSYDMGTCTSPACAPGEDCVDVKPECDSVIVTQCVERWTLPCEAADDCGEGFECAFAEMCTCSGGGSGEGTPGSAPAPMQAGMNPDGTEPNMGSDPAPAGDSEEAAQPEREEPAPLPPDANCDCAPSDVGYCRAKEVECDVDSDCPADWSCQPQYEGGCDMTAPDEPNTATPEPAPAPDAPSSAPAMPPEAEEEADAEGEEDGKEPAPDPAIEPAMDGGSAPIKPTPVCEPVVTRSLCAPPGYAGPPNATPMPGIPGSDPTSPSSPVDQGSSSGDNGGGKGEEGEVIIDAPDEAPGAPDSNDNGAEPSASPVPTAGGEAAAEDGDAEGDDAIEDDAEGVQCAVTVPGQFDGKTGSSAYWLTGLLGLALLRRRR